MMQAAMGTHARLGALTALAVGASIIAVPHLARAQVAPSALVLGSPIITLSYPATDEEAYQAADRAMAAAGIQYVLEGSVRPPDQPAFDYARPPESRTVLTGLPLSRALNEVARADGAFHWAMAGDVVIARFGTMPTPLDAPVAAFDFTEGTPADLLKAVIAAAGLRDSEGWKVSSPRAEGIPPSAFDIHLRQRTFRDVLIAAARSAPTRSLRASYAWLSGALTVASIDIRDGALLAGGGMALAASPAAQNPARISVNAGSLDLSFMLMDYARQSGVSIGIELLPVTFDAPRILGSARVDVTGLSPGDALKRIVAYDSRYQLTARDGWFLVAPKVGVPGRPVILDTPVPPFVRRGESIDVVASDLVARLGARISTPTGSSGAPSPSPSLPPEERMALNRQLLATAAARPASVDLPGETTGRAVVQAIANSTEANSWVLHSTSGRDGRLGYQLTFQFPDGSSVGRSFSLDDGLAPARAPSPTMHILDPTDVVLVVREIARSTNAVVTVELVQSAARPPFHATDGSLLQQFRNLPVEAALSKLMEACEGCSWKKDHDTYRVISARVPKASSPDAWLDRKVSSFRHRFANLREAFNEVQQLAPAGGRGALMGVGGSGGRMSDAHPFEVDLGRSTIRQVLDAITIAAGAHTWSAIYTDANGTFPELSVNLQSGDGQGIGGTIRIR
jgi:hypothetical protein